VKCPKCNAPTEVKETRINLDYVMRRRICFNMHTFRTEEKAVSEPKEKKDDRL
jgi:transcriptional regulator NrdR family protein